MLILCYDTETTGIIRGNDYANPNNPFLASVAALLYDTTAHKVISSLNAMIQPVGWTMPEEAGAINGLSTEYLNAVGLPVGVVLPTFIALAAKADLCVSHNIDFDMKIISAAAWRHMAEDDSISEKTRHDVINNWISLPSFCTMKESKDIVKAQGKGGKIKYPKLTEAYEFFFNKPLDRAHSANADAVAVLEIYLAIQSHKEATNETTVGL